MSCKLFGITPPVRFLFSSFLPSNKSLVDSESRKILTTPPARAPAIIPSGPAKMPPTKAPAPPPITPLAVNLDLSFETSSRSLPIPSSLLLTNSTRLLNKLLTLSLAFSPAACPKDLDLLFFPFRKSIASFSKVVRLNLLLPLPVDGSNEAVPSA